MSQTPNTALAVIGIDIGRNSFHVVGHDARGAIVLGRSGRGPSRNTLCQHAVVHGRHRSMRRRAPSQPQAEAFAEAVQRPTMKFVATKTTDQLDLQALHRVGSGWSASAPASSIKSVPSCWRSPPTRWRGRCQKPKVAGRRRAVSGRARSEVREALVFDVQSQGLRGANRSIRSRCTSPPPIFFRLLPWSQACWCYSCLGS
jgi:hypothetical protein